MLFVASAGSQQLLYRSGIILKFVSNPESLTTKLCTGSDVYLFQGSINLMSKLVPFKLSLLGIGDKEEGGV